VKLPCAPGERENRWMHLMCGEVNVEQLAATFARAPSAAPAGELDALRAEQQRLSDEVTQLRALVERMAADLGISIDRPSSQNEREASRDGEVRYDVAPARHREAGVAIAGIEIWSTDRL